MATKREFISYICEQMSDAGEVTYKLMFGEYGFYLDGVFLGACCDNQVFFKVTEEGRNVLKEELLGEMYTGAKPSFIIEQIDDKEYLCALALATKEGLLKAGQKKGKRK